MKPILPKAIKKKKKRPRNTEKLIRNIETCNRKRKRNQGKTNSESLNEKLSMQILMTNKTILIMSGLAY